MPTPRPEPAPLAEFDNYVDQLAELLPLAQERPHRRQAIAALNGQGAAEIRRRAALDWRRKAGVFFTARPLASRLLAGISLPSSLEIADAACGGGDLLLAAARKLPTESTAIDTLRTWGERLRGRDLNPELIRATRIRLALLASERVGASWPEGESVLAEILPEVRVGDGLEMAFDKPALQLLNPPFGSVTASKSWASGQIPRAALFALEVLKKAPAGSLVRFLLPDVLRSGTHSAQWRNEVETRLGEGRVSVVGRFDAWTDVDVFILRGERADEGSDISWWPRARAERIADHFDVHVGTVVPHRDPNAGSLRPYITASELPVRREFHAGKPTRRYPGPGFEPPFVAVRRTSRPATAAARRLVWTIIKADCPVLVENHLLVCRPHDGTLRSCRALAATLDSDQVTFWLDRRIRCRHLTVGALGQAPYAPSTSA